MYIGLITIAVALLSFGGESFAQSQYELKVVEDVTLELGSTNFDYLIVGLNSGSPKKRSLLKFENLPSGCRTVNDATMYLYYQYSDIGSSRTASFITRTIQAHRVLKSWKVTKATSTKRISFNTEWSTQYLGLDDIDAKRSPTGQITIYPGQPVGFVGIDVTSAVNDWKNGHQNYGVVILATNENQIGNDIRFASKSESDSNKHPYIMVNCAGTPGMD